MPETSQPEKVVPDEKTPSWMLTSRYCLDAPGSAVQAKPTETVLPPEQETAGRPRVAPAASTVSIGAELSSITTAKPVLRAANPSFTIDRREWATSLSSM
jgi:hypothetical protein